MGGATKRSSSAHALMETDKMDENGNHNRMNIRANGDVSRPVRLRGELESTHFIIPKSKPANSMNRQSADELKSPVANKVAGSSPTFSPTNDVPNCSQEQMSQGHSAAKPAFTKLLPAELYDGRGMPVHSGSIATDMVSKCSLTILCATGQKSN